MTSPNFPCPHCGQHLDAPEDIADARVECPACRRPLDMPRAAANPAMAGPPATTESAINFDCQHCRQNIDAPESMAGMEVSCPTCGGQFTVPRCSATAPMGAAEPPAADASEKGATMRIDMPATFAPPPAALHRVLSIKRKPAP